MINLPETEITARWVQLTLAEKKIEFTSCTVVFKGP